MPHPLQQQVRAVARRSQRLLVLHGICCFLGVLLLAAFAVGLADYLLRFRDQGVRIILSGSVLVLLAWSLIHFVLPALLRRYSNLQVARRIERRFPELRDRLSSSIEFLEQAEPAPGSADLRRQVVAEASSLATRLDLLDSIDPTTPRRMLLALLAGMVILGSLCMFDQRSSWLAARRLAVPWSHDAWPRRNSLVFVDPPLQVAAGQDFEIELIDRKGWLPDEVLVEYWFEGDDTAAVQSRHMKRLEQRMVDQLQNVTRPFRVRAVGGDDDTMLWHPVEVVQPPQIEDFEIRVQPPAYTGWPADQSGRHLRVLEGTQISLTARTNKKLKSVRWHGTTRDGPDVVAAQLASDGHGFRWPAEPYVARESGSFWFELTDVDDVINDLQLRCELQVVRDLPPTVSIESPSLDSVLTPHAIVQLKAIVKDDLAVDNITLHYADRELRLSSPASDSRLADPRPATVHGDLRVAEYALDLGQLPDLMPGDSIAFHVAASDFKPQFGESEIRRLSIVSSREFERRTEQRQAAIRQQLAEALRVQRSARLQISSLQVQLDETGRLQGRDVELLQATEMQQRTVRSLLVDEQDGLRALARSLLADALSNRVPQGHIEREMAFLLEQVDQLAKESLDGIEQELRDALADARTGHANQDLDSRLGEAGRAQDLVVKRLEQLLGEFDQRESYRQFSREVSRILQEQESLGRETRGVDTLGKSPNDLSPEQTATLRRLALRQSELAREFDRLQERMRSVAGSMADSDPNIAATLQRALQAARSSAVGGLMREAAQGVKQNQLGRNADLQKRIQDGLRGLIDTLANRDPSGRTDPLDHLAQLEPRLLDLLSRQQSVVTSTEKLSQARIDERGQLATGQLNRLLQLVPKQYDLAQETASLAETIGDAEVYALGLRWASRDMLRAARRLEQAATDRTTIAAQASAVWHLRSLLDSLQLPVQGRPDEQAGEQIGSSSSKPPQTDGVRLGELQLLKLMQQEINRRTAEIHKQRDAEGVLADELALELQQLTAEQGSLASVVLRLGRGAASNELE